MNDLFPFEIEALDRCESVIERGKQTFVEVGTALLEIRDGRLYRQQFDTFEDYCRERWGWTRNYANKLIAATEVIKNLGTIVPTLPATETQSRPLVRLEPDQQREAWQLAIDLAPNGKPTARYVEAAAEVIAPRPVARVVPLSDQAPLFDECDDEHEPEPELPAPTKPFGSGFEKLWENILLFLISLPRRGGIINLIRSRELNNTQIQATFSRFESLRVCLNQSLSEMREEYPWLDKI